MTTRKRILLGCVAGGLVLLVLALLAWGRSLPAAGPIPSATGYDRTLVVVADRDYEPYSFLSETGQPTGYDVELLNAIGHRLKINMDIRLMNWSDCLAAVREGEADLIIGIDYLPKEYPELAFSIANWSDPFVCFGKENFQSFSQLYRKRLAAIEGSGSFPVFLEPYKLTGNTTTYPTYTEALESVLRGENDYAIIRYSVGRRLAAALDSQQLRAVGPNLGKNSNCMAASASRTDLIAQIDHALLALTDEGTVQPLAEKWLGRYVEIISFSDLVQTYGSAILLVLLAGAVLLAGVVLVLSRKQVALARRETASMRRLQEYQTLLNDATNGLYEEIYEVDVTHNCGTSPATGRYFARMGIAEEAPYDSALQQIAEQYVGARFARPYLDLFLSQRVLQAFQAGQRSLQLELTMRRGGGEEQWMRISSRLFYWERDRSVRMITFVENIDDEVRQRQSLQEKALRDELTGLFNKITTEALISQALETDDGGVLVILDLDDFKAINDELGHARGDFVLRETGHILTQTFPPPHIVGRFGGDEFLLYWKEGVHPGGPAAALDRLFSAMSRLVPQEGRPPLTISAGCAQHGPGVGYENLFQLADQALYRCKRTGKHKYEIVTE